MELLVFQERLLLIVKSNEVLNEVKEVSRSNVVELFG